MPEEKTGPNRFGYELLAATGLMLLVAFRFLPTLAEGKLYGPFQDNVLFYGPMFSETARIALQGAFPYYLPSFGTGFPLFETPHYSVCYPFYFFGLLNYGGPVQVLHTLTGLVIFHHFIFALSLYVMLRCARVSPCAALLGASIGVFARNTQLYSSWVTMMAAYAWLPLFIGGAILILRFPGRWLGTLLLGVSAGMIALASPAHALIHALFFSLIFFVTGIVWLFFNRERNRIAPLFASLLIALSIAFGLAAVAVIPMYLGTGRMIRHIGGGFILGYQSIPWAKFNVSQMTIGQLAGILVKPTWINVVGSPYVGPIGVAGVVLVLLSFRRLDAIGRLLVGIFGGIGLYSLVSACGTNLGLAYLNFYLPLLNRSREAGRFLFLFVIAVVFLAGIGFDQAAQWLAKRRGYPKSKYHWRVLLPKLLLLFILIGVGIWELCANEPLSHGGGLVLLLPAIVGVIGLAFRTRGLAMYVLAAGLAAAGSALSPVLTFRLDRSTYTEAGNLRSLQVLSAIRDKIEPKNFRIDFRDRDFDLYAWGMNASYFGFDSFYNLLTPQPYDQFRFSSQRNLPYLRAMMGARYVLYGAGEKPTNPGMQLRLEIQGYKLFENPRYMGRFALVHTFAGTFSSEEDFIAKANSRFNFLSSAYIQEDDLSRAKPFLSENSRSSAPANDQLYISENSVNRASVLVESAQPGVLILNEWFLPAWKARLNGHSKRILRVNEWQVGVPVETGRNFVEFTYRPSLYWGLMILNRITWLALAFTLLAWVVRRFSSTALGSAHSYSAV